MGHCVTKKVQALLLATFHSMTEVDLPLVIEGHLVGTDGPIYVWGAIGPFMPVGSLSVKEGPAV